MRRFTLILSAFIFLVSCQTSQKTIRTAEERKDSETAKASGSKYAISTQGKYATQAADEIFAQGGNIIDAAVAASFTISVERPQSTGIGGGGFMLYRDAKSGKIYAIDFRERAPLKAKADMYLDKDGKVNSRMPQDGALAVAVPGIVAGLLEVHAKFGSLSLEKIMAPAIRLAENGFPVYGEFYEAMKYRSSVLAKDPAAKKIFLTNKNEGLPMGHIVTQKDLAKTLKIISEKGRDGFYKGSVAKAFVDYSKKNGGIITQLDLDSYKVIWREPVHGSFKGYEIYSMPPPSSGGIHVIQFLKFLERDKLASKGLLSTESIHLAASALQSSFADRAKYLGDPDFVKVPMKGLIDSKYVESRRAEVNLKKARKADQVQAGNPLPYESTDTTHLSIMDAQGNAVASTQTVNGWMGAAVVVPGTGILLNNEMDDFSAQAGASNMFGAIGGDANAIVPQKTPLSSMSPTLLLKDDVPQLAVGAPGGTRIISCVAQTILNYVEFKLPLYEAVSSVRYHQQWKPDVLYIDPPGPGEKVIQELKDMGYQVQVQNIPCKVMAVSREGSTLQGVSDPRDIGTSLAK